MRIIATAVLILLTLELTQAEPRQAKERNHNYILRRQDAGLVSGVPTIRRIIGKREIDIYRNGLAFEGDHVVGDQALIVQASHGRQETHVLRFLTCPSIADTRGPNAEQDRTHSPFGSRRIIRAARTQKASPTLDCGRPPPRATYRLVGVIRTSEALRNLDS